MAEHRSEREDREQKMRSYRDSIGNPYPAKSNRTHSTKQVLEFFESLTDTSVTIAGRVRYWRDHGKLTFAQIEDATGQLQVAFSKDELDSEVYKNLKLFDVGDIMQITGKPFVTQKGEQSLLVEEYVLLSKALQPLPDKWHGIQDEEMRYRRRYVDMLMRPELREMFIKKSRFWDAMRQFLVDEGFLEVETPVLETTPGGADAEPFTTHHNALDIDLYLRISMGELWQKRLMVAGFEKTFEIGRQFRNEGISPEHLQDYTQMEFYWAYADYNDTMQLVERMYKHCIMESFGTLTFVIGDFSIDLDVPWEHLDYVTAVQEGTGINILEATNEEMVKKCEELGMEVAAKDSRGRLMDSLWKYCRKSVSGPVFLVNHPVEVSPLAKRKEDDPRLVERYQVIIGGSEVGNGYSELNDPIDQAERFAEQANLREAGDLEAQMHDADFVEALEVGMPPTSGFGVSERLFSFLMNKPIRECVMFPLLKPKNEPQESSSSDLSEIEADGTLEEFDPGISRDDALTMMLENIEDQNLRNHMLATEALMRRLAEHFGAKNVEAWGIAGLLHDVDYQNVEMDQHSLVGAQMLEEAGVHSYIVDAVREHNFHHGIEAKTLLSKNLQCLEQLTGLITACVYVRPDKKLASVKVKSVKKKFKNKSFAKGVDREFILKCEEMLGLSLDESIEICLEAMQGIADELGFA